MAKLPKSIIKKYGISKKAWRIFKSKRKAPKKAKVKTMAKRRKAQPKGFMQKIMAKIGTPLAAVAYGYTRDKISDALMMSKIGQQLPLTNFTDELAMLGVVWGARKFGLAGNPIGGKLIRAVETVEWSRIGETLSDMQQGLQGNAASGNSSLAKANELFN